MRSQKAGPAGNQNAFLGVIYSRHGLNLKLL
ncbi:hypothetical protein J2T55_002410 [Methylohalomonas lacus]|uniref:Uncharacterized protein n=1 Tax=Methylohalomonas lacus TaxID=398773 RepID=A0AAE3L1P5_9GAMM|nr:hypothetical protein [Methylohalomonas lacus]